MRRLIPLVLAACSSSAPTELVVTGQRTTVVQLPELAGAAISSSCQAAGNAGAVSISCDSDGKGLGALGFDCRTATRDRPVSFVLGDARYTAYCR